MEHRFEDEFWTEIRRERWRLYAIFFGLACFSLITPFLRAPEHHLALGIGCAAYFLTVLFVLSSWFVRAQPAPARPNVRSGRSGKDRCRLCRRVHDGADRYLRRQGLGS